MAKWQVVQPAHTGGGGAAGVQAVSASDASFSGTVVITGGANITVSTAAGSKIVIDGGAGGAGGSFSAGVSNIGNTAGNTKTVSNQLVLAGGNNVTLSQSTDAGGATVTISGVNTVAQSVQTQNMVALSATNTLYSSGTVTLTGSNMVTVKSSAAGQAIIFDATQSVQTQSNIQGIRASDTTYVTGTVTITGVGGGITVSSNTGQRIDLSVAAPVAQTGTQFSAGISGGNTAGDTGTVAGRVVFAGGNNITVSGSTNGVSETITISGPNTAAQTGTQFSAGISGGNTAGDTGTVAGRVVFAGGNNITLSGSTNGVSETITISAPNVGGAQTGISSIAASNTTYTSGQVEFTGSNMVTVKSSANQRVVIDATQTVQTQNVHNLSFSTTAGGATTGTMAEISSGTVTMYAGNNMTISQSATNKVVLSALASSSLSAYTNITLSVTSDTIKFSVADPPQLAEWRNFERADGGWIGRLDGSTKTAMFFEEVIPGAVKPASIVLQLNNFSTGTLQSFDVHFGVYTFVNSTSAALLGSGSNNFNISTASSASWSGARNFVLTSPGTVAAISNLTPGNYLFGMMFSAGATGSIAQSLWAVSNTNTTAYPLGRVLPGNNQLSTATSQGAHPMFGQLSSTVNALPSNIVASDIRNQGTATLQIRPWILLRS